MQTFARKNFIIYVRKLKMSNKKYSQRKLSFATDKIVNNKHGGLNVQIKFRLVSMD